jgi:hypothetical protein
MRGSLPSSAGAAVPTRPTCATEDDRTPNHPHAFELGRCVAAHSREFRSNRWNLHSSSISRDIMMRPHVQLHARHALFVVCVSGVIVSVLGDRGVNFTSASSSSAFRFSALDWVEIAWMTIDALVLVSPCIALLKEAGTYGKLKNDANGKKEQADQHAPKSTDAASAKSILLHPALHLTTKTAFTSYYLLASLWNGALFAECLVSHTARHRQRI